MTPIWSKTPDREYREYREDEQLFEGVERFDHSQQHDPWKGEGTRVLLQCPRGSEEIEIYWPGQI